jgi:hypothetical protein
MKLRILVALFALALVAPSPPAVAAGPVPVEPSHPPVVATSTIPLKPPRIAAVCSTVDDYVWGILSDESDLSSYTVDYWTTDHAKWHMSGELHLNSYVSGHAAFAFISKDEGSTLHVRWANYPALEASNSTPGFSTCAPGSITVTITVEGGTAQPGAFSPAISGQLPNPPFTARAAIAWSPGTPVSVLPGWYRLVNQVDKLPAGYHLTSATCGTDSTTKPDQPSLGFEVDPTGSVTCAVVYRFQQPAATKLTDSISSGINKGSTGFQTGTLTVASGSWVTYRVLTAPNLAGRGVQIWTKSKTGPWKLAATRKTAADGITRYYVRVTEWTSFRAKWPGDASFAAASSHGRVATVR